MFSCEYYKVFKNSLFYRTPQAAACAYPTFEVGLPYIWDRLPFDRPLGQKQLH